VDDSSVLSVATVHSDPGPHNNLGPRLQTHTSDLSQPLRFYNDHTLEEEEEESGHFVATKQSEQTPGQDSTSAPSLLPESIEPDSSMLTEDDDDKIPTSEPSSSSEPLRSVVRGSFHYESTQSARMFMQETEQTSMYESEQSDPNVPAETEAPQIADSERNEGTSTDQSDEADGLSASLSGADDSQNVFRQSERTAPLYTADAETDTIHLNISNESEQVDLSVSFEDDHADEKADVPAQVMGADDDDDSSEFNVSLPMPPWDSNIPLDPWLNCYGVVHVRLLCAQRLPCPVGSSVQGIVALPPWKGRVRTERTGAFLGPELSGVCVRWDQLHDDGYCSMVNSWNSLDNPTPTIAIDLVFHPLQMLEFPMCSVKLSCAPLMREPGEWKKQWCQTTISQKVNDSEGYLEADERVPLLLLEAMFVPSGMDEDLAEDSVHNLQAIDEESSVEPASSIGNTVSPSIRNRKYAGGSVGTGASYILSPRTKSHLLRVQSLWVPAACAVCSTVIVGWKSAYRCEACNIDCCKDCQLQVDLQIPCGSSVAEAAVAASFHNKLTVHNIMNVLAPWDETAEKELSLPESTHGTKSAAQVTGDTDGTADKEVGIGTLQVHIARACIFAKTLHPESNPDDVFKELDDQASRRGDYYVRLTSSGNQQSRRTRTIQNSGKPQFDSEELTFNV